MMKYYMLMAFLVIGFLFSCNKKDDPQIETELVGNWKLVEMTGSVPNSETTGADMEWQESYQLNEDGTFLKSRNRDGVITESSGTYQEVNSLNERLLELIFNEESEILGTCYSDVLKENMVFQSDNIFSSTWQACDGPGLKYQKAD